MDGRADGARLDRTTFAKLDFLIGQGAGRRSHSGRTLLAHLHGTRQLLVMWGARPSLCDAGLFHSVYGTQHFPNGVIEGSERGQVRCLIGSDSEELAFAYGCMDRERFYATIGCGGSYNIFNRFTGELMSSERSQFVDLCNIDAANLVEQCCRDPAGLLAPTYIQRMLPFLLPEAQLAVRSVYGLVADCDGDDA